MRAFRGVLCLARSALSLQTQTHFHLYEAIQQRENWIKKYISWEFLLSTRQKCFSK